MKTSYKALIVLAAVLVIGAAIGLGGNYVHAQVAVDQEEADSYFWDAPKTAHTINTYTPALKSYSLVAGGNISGFTSNACPSGYTATAAFCTSNNGRVYLTQAYVGSSTTASCGFTNAGTVTATVQVAVRCIQVQ